MACKNGLSNADLCIALFLYIILSTFTWWLPSIYIGSIFSDLLAALTFLINWNEMWCSESNILTMCHKLVLENSNSLLFIHCQIPLSIWRSHSIWIWDRDRSIQRTWNLQKVCKRLTIRCCTMAVRIQDYLVWNKKRCDGGCSYILKVWWSV